MSQKLARSPPVPWDKPALSYRGRPPPSAAPLGQPTRLPHVKLSAVRAQRQEPSQLTPDRLVVRTVPVEDPGDLVARLPDPASVAWIRRGDGLAGWGEAARVSLPAGEDRFTAGEKWLTELFDGAEVTDRGRAARLRPGGLRQLHLRPDVRRLGARRPRGRARPCRGPLLADHHRHPAAIPDRGLPRRPGPGRAGPGRAALARRKPDRTAMAARGPRGRGPDPGR